jgi:hypothetical protein
MRATIVLLAVVLFLAGCSSLKKDIDNINASDSASGNLESYIQGDLTTHRNAATLPHVPSCMALGSHDVSYCRAGWLAAVRLAACRALIVATPSPAHVR